MSEAKPGTNEGRRDIYDKLEDVTKAVASRLGTEDIPTEENGFNSESGLFRSGWHGEQKTFTTENGLKVTAFWGGYPRENRELSVLVEKDGHSKWVDNLLTKADKEHMSTL